MEKVMGSHAALIAELESAQEGSRALSDEVLLALGWKREQVSLSPPGLHSWKMPDGTWAEGLPDPTRDLQDIVDLVPERWGWSISDTGSGLIYQKDKIPGEYGHPILADIDGGRPPPIGMCIAI